MPNQTLPQLLSTTHFKYDIFSLVNSKAWKSADKPWFLRKSPSVNLGSELENQNPDPYAA